MTSNMQITASLVNELRQKTGVGMMQCKKALVETDGDMDKAIELLRKQGAAVAAKRADKAAKEGRIYLVETADKAAAFELSCETEPVSNNDDFIALAAMAQKAVETQAIASVDDLKNAVVDGVKVGDRLQDVLVKIQENIDFRKFAEIKKTPNTVFGLYSHMKGKIGVITELAFEGSADEAALKQAAKDIAMQAAAFAPVALNDAAVPQETIDKEREIARAQIENAAKESGKVTKPEFVERQLDGRVAKVLKEIVLEDQEFFMSEKNPKKLSVKAYLQEVVAKQLGLSSLKVVNFIRFERGN
ncbi:MAG: translation elongation factor Ts [Fibrobacter sp.]|nr:translation elongation factor Ts [Fibrobacter sp.]